MDGNYLTSIDPMCSVEGGVFCWLAHLRPDQIKELRQRSGALTAIVPNAHLESTRSMNLGPSQLRAYDNDTEIITVGPIWTTGDKIPGLEGIVNGAPMQWSPGTPNFMPTVHAPSNGN